MMQLTNSENPITPKPGIYYDVPFEKYMAWNCFSKSMTGPALRSGKHLEAYIKSGKSTKSMDLGSVVDCLTLEPHLYNELFVLQPDTYPKEITRGRAPNKVTTIENKPWTMKSKTCQEIAATLGASGKTIISANMLKLGKACKDSVMANLEAAEAIAGGKRQVSIVWVDEGDADEEGTGILCKGRYDILHDAINDLKTTVDASPEAFSRTIEKFKYHVQGGIYTAAHKQLTGEQKDWRMIAVETSEETEKPLTAVYEMLYDDESLVAGRKMFRRALKQVLKYGGKEVPGYSKYAEPISIAQWAIDKEFRLHEEVSL